ncbi:MAG TPA: hypothetical protein V6C81_27170 [Planktothrix sp.]|jgi:nucleotide-binding universal stress UspA family protein
MSEYNVCAQYREGRRAMKALEYAVDLAGRLDAAALHVYLPRHVGVKPPPTTSFSAREMQLDRVAERVRSIFAGTIVVHDDVDLEQATMQQLPPVAIVVSRELAQRRTDLHIVQPFEEESVVRGGGGILVPFGDGESGIIAAAEALPLAAQLKSDVIFYHTTWRSPHVSSTNPLDHLCGDAKRHFDELTAMAQTYGVRSHMEIEMADDVVVGMLRCAANGAVASHNPKPADLIVMTHGVNTCFGSYVEKALQKSATPVLVIASARRGGER